RDRAWLGVSFASCPASVAATLLQLCAPLTDRWRSLAVGNVHHVRLREYVPFPRARIRLPGWREICLRVRLHAPFRLVLLPAYQFVSLPMTHLDVTKNAQVAAFYLITPRIEQPTITKNILRDRNDYQSYAPRGPGEKEH